MQSKLQYVILEQNEERLLSRSRHGRNRPDSIFVKPPGSVTMTASAEEHCKKHLENRNKGIRIVVDKKDLVYLDGVVVDYQKKGLNEGYEFINEKEKARCGCGESFTV